MTKKSVGIIGVGNAIPDRVITNHDFVEMGLETSDEWIQERTGIVERHVVDEDTKSSDLALEAAKAAIDASGLMVTDIDLIIVATATPDYPGFPSTACILQKKLGLSDSSVPAFDLVAACSGFNYAVTTAQQYVVTGQAKHVLVVGVDCLSQIMDWSDRGTCILFGDGAGAVIVSEVGESYGIQFSKLYANGELADSLKVLPQTKEAPKNTTREGAPYIDMNGKAVYKAAVDVVVPTIKDALAACNLTEEDISLVVLHQANKRIMNAVKERIQFPDEKVYINVDRFGNTSAASIPIVLAEAVETGKLNEGDIIICLGFGAGFTWGVNIIKWGGKIA